MKNLNLIIKKYNSEAEIFQHEEDEECFICSNFPEKLEQPIKDYIECHSNVLYSDYYSITFKTKRNENICNNKQEYKHYI